MSLQPSTRLGPYEIISSIGAGGMGEVYRARDTRLDRIVAVKVLPEHLSSNPQLRERFEREAKAISSLSHPHICPLYDVGHQDGIDYLVMEYLEGQTLAARLKKGPFALEQALQYAIQITDALDTAHRHGVIHRDLKPGNIVLTKAGVKLVDFGLAKIQAAEAVPGTTALPTQTTPLTGQGTILGTLQYMAPEQLEGKEADARSDIFAFGSVLYEMVTGKRAFEGKSQAGMIAAILERNPPSVTGVVPAALDRALRRCLTKHPDDRWQTARDLKAELDWIAKSGTAVEATLAPAHSRWRERSVLMLAVLSVGVLLFLAGLRWRVHSAGELTRFAIYPPEKTTFSGPRASVAPAPQFALSPDGHAIVFTASDIGARSVLWLRTTEEVAARSLPGTENSESPFWSPDSRWVCFFAEGKLKKIRVAGGPPQILAEGIADARGGSWGPGDTILFAAGTTPIFQISSSGGKATPVTKLESSGHEGSHRWPQFLPDGRHFLFLVRSSLAERRGIFAGSVDGKTRKFLMRSEASPVYAPPGYLLFVDGDTLQAQSFDAARLELSGQPFTVAERVGRSSYGYGAFSVSLTGVLAYAGAILQPGRLTWFDRGGNPIEAVGPEGEYNGFRLSPNQKRLAASMVDRREATADIWLIDLARRSRSRFTFGPLLNVAPVWSPDGTRVVFGTNRKGVMEFYQKSAAGGGDEEPILSQETLYAAHLQSINNYPTDWSADGKYILYSTPTLASGLDLFLLPGPGIPGARRPVKLLGSPSDEMHGNFSPDGHFVAYTSNESGRYEVYVQTFPLLDRKWPISTNGGYEPRWRRDGREIYYLSEDRKLMAVSVATGPSFGVPQPLFQTRVPTGVSDYRTHYVPTPDGRRFLVNTQSGDPPPNPITVVLNWTAGMTR